MATHEELKQLADRSLFTDQEWSERRRHITMLKNFHGMSVAAAKALRQITEKKLYRPHATIKEFCRVECGWTEQRLYQIIKFAQVRASLPGKTKQLLSRESHARELAKVPESDRAAVLEQANRDGEVTAKSIQEAASRIIEGPVDKMGYPITAKAMPYWNRKAEIQEILTHLSKARSIIRDVKDGDPLYRKVRLQEIDIRLDKSFNELKGILPAHVCVTCDGLNIRQCPSCNGTGLISEYAWKSILPEQRKRREQWRLQTTSK
jgi:hypothetical protein